MKKWVITVTENDNTEHQLVINVKPYAIERYKCYQRAKECEHIKNVSMMEVDV